MGAHESPEATLAAVETDAIRHRAAALIFELDGLLELESCIIDPATWRKAIMGWAGSASEVLREVARG